jgi:hypothetical protein
MRTAATLLRVVCQSFDNGGESSRSLRALCAETAFIILDTKDDESFAQYYKCDADPWAFMAAARMKL